MIPISSWVTCCVLTALVAICSSNSFAVENPITFGVIDDRQINLLIDQGPLPEALREVLTRRLLRLVRGADIPRLDLADALRVSSDGLTVSLRVRAGVEMSNGNELTLEDVRFSLDRCARLSDSGQFAVARRMSVNSLTDQAESWVDVTASSAAERGGLVQFVADCPIIEARSSEVFGTALGEGSNLVSAGDFSIRSFNARGDIELVRRGTLATSRSRAEALVFRRVESEKAGITALRVGTVDGLLLRSLSATALEGDETLRAEACSGFTIVSRRGLVLSCEGGLQLGEAHYVR